MDPNVSVYCDSFQVTPTPFGLNFEFGRHDGAAFHPATMVGMSIEHAKAMVFMTARNILQHEASSGLVTPLPDKLIEQVIKTTVADWDAFWYGWKDGKPFGPASLPTTDPAPEPETGESTGTAEPAKPPMGG